MPLSDAERRRLADGWRTVVARTAPGWADANAGDPGVTLLQLLAYAVEDLAHRPPSLDAETRALAARVARQADSLASRAEDAGDGAGGLSRVHYRAGQLLDVRALQDEQAYVRSRLRRRNRWLHGSGIVRGLDVTTSGDSITVEPGFALDPHGEEIEVGAPIRVTVPPGLARPYVLVRYEECPRCETAAAGESTSGASGEPHATHIEERARISVESAPSADAVALARLRRVRGAWRRDPTFRTPRARR